MSKSSDMLRVAVAETPANHRTRVRTNHRVGGRCLHKSHRKELQKHSEQERKYVRGKYEKHVSNKDVSDQVNNQMKASVTES